MDVRSDYSVGLQTFFREQFKQLGGQIVSEQSYSQGDSDFRAQLTQIKATNPDAIYVPGYYTEVGTIARQARELGIPSTVPLLGGDGWDSPKLWEIGGEALNGCYFSNHYSVDDPFAARPEVRRGLQGALQGRPPTPWPPSATTRPRSWPTPCRGPARPTDRRCATRSAATKDFSGVTGKITINKDRNAIKPAVVLKVENGKFVYVETVSP